MINENIFDKLKQRKQMKQYENYAKSDDPFIKATAKTILAQKKLGVDTSKSEEEFKKLLQSRASSSNAKQENPAINTQDTNNVKQNVTSNVKQGEMINNNLSELTKQYKELIAKRNATTDMNKKMQINVEMKSLTNEINRLRNKQVNEEFEFFKY